MPSLLRSAILGCAVALTTASAIAAQTAEDRDRLDMMEQLHIQALRPGPSGNEAAPNHANYDEAKANPHPTLPDPLVTLAGKPVTSAAMWWKVRRPEIVEAYEREVYGRIPANVPKVTWRVAASEQERLGFPGTPVLARQMIGHVDNSADPAISVDIRMTVVTPADAKSPVPLLVMFAPDGFPAPTQPSREEFGRIDAALKAAAVQQDGSLAAVFSAHPGFTLVTPPPLFRLPERNADGDPMNPEQLAAAGWGFALLDTASVQADNGAGLRQGIIGLTNRGGPRTPDQWGALRAWGWAASRALDFFGTDPTVDAKHVGIEGVSRWGKAALVTMAFDQRFAMVLVGSSGKGGATPLRRDWGEDISNLATGTYYWFAGNLLKYDATKASSRLLDTGDLPVDSNDLIALCAPRLTFISYGVPEKGDARWLDHRGSWMATVSASKVWNLLGAKGVGVTQDYHVAPMPAVNQGLLDGQLAWRQHDGGHTDAPNMKWFLQWANRNIGHVPPPPS
ncbi:MAG TPA: hypothetical protein VGC28_02095 [Sphingomonas sp.]